MRDPKLRELIEKVELEEKLDEATTIIMCKLCKIKFRKEELQKVVTTTMLLKFIQHQRKRGVFLFENSTNLNFSQLQSEHRLCDLCFSLIVAENELIDLETGFAHYLNIPYERNLLFQSKKYEKENEYYAKVMIEELDPKPVQWRILIYL